MTTRTPVQVLFVFAFCYCASTVLYSASLCNTQHKVDCMVPPRVEGDSVGCGGENGGYYVTTGNCDGWANAVASNNQCGFMIIFDTGEPVIVNGVVVQCGDYRVKTCQSGPCVPS